MKKLLLILTLFLVSVFVLTACDSTPEESSSTKKPGIAETVCTHEWSEWEITTTPTCTQSGTQKRVCAECAQTERETVDALGHSYSDPANATVTPATCTSNGHAEYRCTRCNSYVSETLEKLGHSFTNYVETAATCKNDTYKTAKCDRCEETDTQTLSGTALGHEYGEDSRCTRCGEIDANKQLQSLEITNDSFLLEAGIPTQIEFAAYPTNAVFEKVVYRIYQNNTCDAVLTEDGILTCGKVGSVTIAVTIDESITARATFYVPQMITTAEEFYNMRNDLGGVYMLANDIDLSSYAAWKPIGNATKSATGNYDYTNAFSGKFDGNGYKITGLNLDLESSECNSLLTVGLFGSLSRDGLVSNVILENAVISGSNNTTDYVGLLVGFNPGSISGCDVSGTMTVAGATYVGGAVGENIGSLKAVDTSIDITVTGSEGYIVGGVTGRSTGGAISDVSAEGKISVTSNANVSVGGIAAVLADKLDTAEANVALSVTTTASSGDNYVGVIAGHASHDISGMTANGSVMLTANSNVYVGGLVGYGTGAFSECINNAPLSVTVSSSSATTFVGGIVGNSSKVVSSCENAASVRVEQMYYGYVGGVAGRATEVSACTNGAYVYAKINSKNVYAGGVVGYASESVLSCQNTGNMTVADNTTSAADAKQYFGGVVAYTEKSVSALENYASISVTANGIAYVGGTVGFAYENAKNSYNYGESVALSSPYIEKDETSRVGGVIARANGTVSDSANYANVSANTKGLICLGGVAGYAYGSLSAVNNYGYSITVESDNPVEYSTDHNYVGGVVGYAYASLSTAYNTASISVKKSDVYLGGIVGYANGSIQSAVSTGDISAKTGSSSEKIITRVGGIAGEASSTIASSGVTSSSISVQSRNVVYAGGIVGIGNGIQNSYSYAGVSAPNSYGGYVGGIAGTVNSISKSYSMGSVSATANGAYDVYVGGLAGAVSNAVTESYASGDVYAASSAKVYVAGLIGYAKSGSTVSNSYASYGYVKTNSSGVSASSEVTAYNGGLIGYNSGTVKNCYTVNYMYSISHGSSNSHSHYVGGLVGYNAGKISASYVLDASDKIARIGLETNRDVVGSGTANLFYAGGFVGYNSGTVNDCYTEATVNTTVSGAHTGGFVGYNGGTVHSAIAYGEVNSGITGATTGGFSGGGTTGYTTCFFSTETTLQATAVGEKAQVGVTASTSSDLRKLATFVAFDNKIWNITSGAYPTLILGTAWENRSDGFNKYNMLVNVANESCQYQFPHDNKLTVTIEDNYGKTLEAVTALHGEAVRLPKRFDYTADNETYLFLGYFADAELTTPIEHELYTVTENATVYAGYRIRASRPASVKHTYTGEEIGVADTYSNTAYYTVAGDFVGTNAGTYTLTFTLNDGYCWPDKTRDDYVLTWEIEPIAVVSVPAIYDFGTYVFYTGTARDLAAEFAGEWYTVSGDTVIAEQNDTVHTVKFALNDTAGYVWNDGSTEDKIFTYEIVTGACNATNTTVVYILQDGVLTLKGKGAMANYTLVEAPWYEERDTVRSLVIGDGITKLGNSAFSSCTSLTSIEADASNAYFSSLDGNLYNKNQTTLIQYAIGKTDTQFEIPDSVKGIGSYAFSGCTSLASITIGDSVTSIGYEAFSGCTSLTSVTIGNSVTRIGYEAFNGCTSLTSVTIPDSVTSIDSHTFANCSSLTSVTIPDSVTSIGYAAFQDCSSLTSVTIPDSVTSINSQAFYGCTSLRSIEVDASNAYFSSLNGNLYNKNQTTLIRYAIGKTDTQFEIPDSVTSIGNYAFYKCKNLTSVTIPDSVTSIGNSAFYGCPKLVEVINKSSLSITAGSSSNGYVAYYAKEVHSGDSKIVNKDGYLFYTYAGTNYLLGYVGNDTELVLPDNYNGEDYEIYQYAFYNRKDLTSVTIGNSVTRIGYAAFQDCSSLTSVTIGNSVTSICDWAFYACNSLTSVTIPDSVTSIGYAAFQDCSSLTSVTIGNSVTTIGYKAFYGCTSLRSIEVDASNAYFSSLNGNLYNKNQTTLIRYAIGKTDTQFEIPDSVTSIGGYAFQDCSSLTSVTVGNSVTSIGDWAFAYCNKLTSISIPDSVTSIGQGAFYSCNSALYTEYAYGKYVGDKENPYAVLIALTNKNFKTYTIHEETQVIAFGVFQGCGRLENIEIPDSVTSIGNYAFEGCDRLTSVTIPDSVTSIGNKAFYGCPIQIATIPTIAISSIPQGSLKTVVITSGDSIGDSAFSYCNQLTSISIPDSVTSIGNSAFEGCRKLVEVINKSSLSITAGSSSNGYVAYYAKEVHSGDSKIVNLEDYLFYTYNGKNYLLGYVGNDTALVLPDNYNGEDYEIYQYAFYNRKDLTSVTIGNSVTSIGEEAFYSCTSLTSVTIGNSVTSIGGDAFHNCISLKSVTIGNSVTSIGYWAFYDCKSLKSIEVAASNAYYSSLDGNLYNKNQTTLIQYAIGKTDMLFNIPDSVTSIRDYAFAYCNKLTSISIPDSVTSIGYMAFYSCDSLTSVTIGNSVTSIGSAAFYNCKSLTSVTIGNSVTSIGSSAFYNCKSLTSVTFKNTSGWYVSTNSSATSGTSVTVTNASTAATYLKSTYCGYYYWKRK